MEGMNSKLKIFLYIKYKVFIDRIYRFNNNLKNNTL